MNYAGFWIRFGAALIDIVLFVLVTFPLLFIFYGEDYWTSDELVKGPMDFVLTYMFPGVVVIAFWIKRQATPGKITLSLRIIDAQTGGIPTSGQFIGRYFAQYISAIPIGLGFLWVAFDSRKQGWHDKLAGTVVIREDKDLYNSDKSASYRPGDSFSESPLQDSIGEEKWVMAGFTTSGHVVRFAIDFSLLAQNSPGIFVGRDPTQSDCHIRDDSVSRKHAVITLENGVLFVKDLGSTNGTYVNDKRLNVSEKRRLNSEDSIQFGNVILTIGRD